MHDKHKIATRKIKAKLRTHLSRRPSTAPCRADKPPNTWRILTGGYLGHHLLPAVLRPAPQGETSLEEPSDPAAKARANPGESVRAFSTTFHSLVAPKVAPASRVTKLVTSPMGPVVMLAGMPGQEWDFLLWWPRAIFPESPDDYHV